MFQHSLFSFTRLPNIFALEHILMQRQQQVSEHRAEQQRVAQQRVQQQREQREKQREKQREQREQNKEKQRQLREAKGANVGQSGHDRRPEAPEGTTLDDLFRKTTAKPCLYFLPKSEAEVARVREARE